jgi:hypothetical protein
MVRYSYIYWILSSFYSLIIIWVLFQRCLSPLETVELSFITEDDSQHLVSNSGQWLLSRSNFWEKVCEVYKLVMSDVEMFENISHVISHKYLSSYNLLDLLLLHLVLCWIHISILLLLALFERRFVKSLQTSVTYYHIAFVRLVSSPLIRIHTKSHHALLARFIMAFCQAWSRVTQLNPCLFGREIVCDSATVDVAQYCFLVHLINEKFITPYK